MKKLLKNTKRWFRYNGRNLGIGLTIVGTLGFGVWYAVTQQEEVVVEDFGDAAFSVVAKEISDLSYADAVQLIENGEKAKGLAVMKRLAPLSSAIKGDFGNGDAHIWVAKDLLGEVPFGFLQELPTGLVEGVQPAVARASVDEKILERGMQHLSAAMSLKTQQEVPAVMQAEVYLSQNKRNEAIALLVKHAAKENGALMQLAFWLANTAEFKGDDLALKELLWHQFTTQGEAITGSEIGNVEMRLEYVLHALLLGKFELAETAIAKFERDFGDIEGNQQLVKKLRAVQQYFEAVVALQAKDVTTATSHLKQALELVVDEPFLITAVQRLLEKYPDAEVQFSALLGNVEVDDSTSVSMLMLKATVFDAQKAELLGRAVAQEGSNLEAVRAYVRHCLGQDEVDQQAVLAVLDPVVADISLEGDVAFELLNAYGELQVSQGKWQEALLTFERALVCKPEGEQLSALHKQLAAVYGQLGMDIVASEHLALAQ